MTRSLALAVFMGGRISEGWGAVERLELPVWSSIEENPGVALELGLTRIDADEEDGMMARFSEQRESGESSLQARGPRSASVAQEPGRHATNLVALEPGTSFTG